MAKISNSVFDWFIESVVCVIELLLHLDSYQSGRSGRLEKTGHVFDGKHMDAEVLQLPREIKVVLQVVLTPAVAYSMCNLIQGQKITSR